MVKEKTPKTKDEELPQNWRVLVSERLAALGITANSRKVFDVCARGCKNSVLEKQILDAVNEIKKEYRRQTRTRKKLRTVIGLN